MSMARGSRARGSKTSASRARASSRRDTRLRGLVKAHIDFVARTLRNLGVPEAEIDDAVQRTFFVASRRLDDIRAGAERAFLFKTALHDAAHVRRSLARRREVMGEQVWDRGQLVATPEQLADRNRARELLDQIFGSMPLELRTVFVLYEVEELTMAEIAIALDLPPGTVASRLRRARTDFRRRVARLQSRDL
jgi:RNA polymerase sigma-70 factor (ECF subfamily)